MSTTAATSTTSTATKPRVWLVAGLGTAPEPADHPTVRDDLMRTWEADAAGRYSTAGGRHTATWDELHNRHDLVEVVR